MTTIVQSYQEQKDYVDSFRKSVIAENPLIKVDVKPNERYQTNANGSEETAETRPSTRVSTMATAMIKEEKGEAGSDNSSDD